MQWFQLNVRHLGAFAATVRLGTVTAAARAINITQPAITQGIAKLEVQLGHQLFDRRPNGMVAVPPAKMFAGRVATALSHIASTRVTMAAVRGLIAVADAGSYAGASADTGLTQPSLHRVVKDLSIALNRQLLERRGKGIALTRQGRRTLRAYRLARSELEAGLSELAALNGQDTSRIRVGAMPLCRARLLPSAAAAFHHQYPDSTTVITEGAFRDLVEPLRDGVIDIMIGALRDSSVVKDLRQQSLFIDRPVVLGRPGHPLSHRRRKTTISDLTRFPWVISAPGTPLRIQWERLFAGKAAPKIPIESGSAFANREILRKTECLTLQSPDQVAVELQAGWLVKICDAPAVLERNIGIITRLGWQPTAMHSKFIQLLKHYASEIELDKTSNSAGDSTGAVIAH